MRLGETGLPVNIIADEVGLPNLANFNRQFRRVRQLTPTAYREYFRAHGTSPGRSTAEELLIRPPSLDRRRRIDDQFRTASHARAFPDRQCRLPMTLSGWLRSRI